MQNIRSPLVAVGRSHATPAELENLPVLEASFWADGNFMYPVPGEEDHLYAGSPWHWLGFGAMEGHPRNASFQGDQLLAMEIRGKHWKAENEGFFNSVTMPMAKAIRALSGNSADASADDFDSVRGWAAAETVFPLLVTSSPLFQVDTAENPLRAVEVPWVTVSRELQTRSVQGELHMAVVQAEGLDEYLQTQVFPFGFASAAVLERNPSALTVRQAFPLED
jgi:hypothetical protein